jgi:hypothetical protein
MARGAIYDGGGCIRSWLTLDARLILGEGVYQSINPILMKSGSTLEGSGWSRTVLIGSPTAGQFTVVGAYNSTQSNGATDAGITIKDLRIVGANPDFGSVAQAIALGNCSGCLVDKVWIDSVRSIGVQLGGGDTFYGPGGEQFHYYALDSKITNCLFTRVASQAVALTNCQNCEISTNQILRPGQIGGPGSSSIDLEVNGGIDRLVNIQIVNNVINHDGAEVDTTGNGIIVNSGNIPRPNISKVLIEGNTIIGGHRDPPITNKLSNAIYVVGENANDVTIRLNKITRTGQSGIRLEGSNLVCEDNQLDSVGGGGTFGFVAIVNNSRIRHNFLVCSGGPCDGTMEVTGTGNTVENNPGWIVK